MIRIRQGGAFLGVMLAGMLATGGTPAAGSDGPAATTKVATWNLLSDWVANGHSKIDDWAKTIAKVRPDVLGVQEVCNWQLSELVTELKEKHQQTYYFQPGPVHEKNQALNGCGSGVKYGQGMLTKAPASDVRVYKYAEHGDEVRGYMAVRTTVAGKGTWVFNTHTDYAKDVLPGQLKELLQHAGQGANVIVLGDLNTTPDNKELRKHKQDAGFRDAAPQCDKYPTDTSKCLPTHEGGKRIDFILLKGFTPPGTERLSSTASDHRLLAANVS